MVNLTGFCTSVTWTDITDTLSNFINLYYGDGISNIAVHPRDENIIYVTLSGYSPNMKNRRIFKTTDGGNSWTNINENLPDFPIISIRVLDNDNEEIFVGTDVGLYYKSATMNDWEPINNNLPMCIISDIEIDEQNGMMYIGTFGRGVWESVLPCSPSSGTLTIEGNTTWNVDKRIYTNIEIDSGATLTVKKDLLMSANGKITVHKGGKLIVDGGRISVGCGYMWAGIVVEGNKHHAQSNTTHGWCEVKNDGTIERARIGIKSNGGGIVKVNDGHFVNNRFSISFSQYSLAENGNHVNLSRILNSTFVCNKPISDPYYTDDGVREGSKSHISIAQQDRIYIYNNTFESTYQPRADLKGTGIVTWASRVEIRNNSFNGLTYGIESAGYLSPLQFNNIINNEFTDVSLAITETGMAGSHLRENSIILPEYVGNPWLMENYGIRQETSRGFNISNNSIRVPSTIDNFNIYGVLVRNSDSTTCNVEHNYFRKLDFATQLEGNNKEIGIQCNKYYDSNQDWSINPVTVGVIHNFGDDEQQNVQAANYFPDLIESESQKNIRLNENMTFIYYSVAAPDSAIPLDVTENVSIFPVDGSIYEEECEIPFDPCGGNPIPCVAYAQDLVLANSEADPLVLFKYKLNLAQQLRDSGMIEELRVLLEEETSASWEELKLPVYIEYREAMNIDVQSLIDNLPSGDYKEFMQLVFNINEEGISIDSITDENGPGGDFIQIAEGSSEISAAAKKVLEIFYGYQYVREAERWQETSLVRNNTKGTIKASSNQEENGDDNIQTENEHLKQTIKPDFLLIPNPSDGDFVVRLLSSTNGEVSIIDMHGKIIAEVDVAKEGELLITRGTLVPGVYTIQLINSIESYQLNKRIIILE